MDEKRKKINSIKDKTRKIGIIFGGTPDERPYAERSAIDISQALETLGYSPIKIDFDKNFMNKIKHAKIDLAFLIDATFMDTIDEYERFLNGRGLRQILEELNIPYTGSLLSAAETTKNKVASKVAFLKAGLNTAPYKEIYYERPVKQQAKVIIKQLGLPLILKPRDEGSSIGITVINSHDDLVKAITDLHKEFKHIYVEKYLKGTEVTVSVVEVNRSAKALPVLEINHKAEFYRRDIKTTDFEMDNQGSTASEFHMPARLEKQLYDNVQRDAEIAFNAVGASGYARIDIIIDSTDTPYILEINSLPVLHSKDFVSWAARTEGITYEKLIQGIIDSALDKHIEK